MSNPITFSSPLPAKRLWFESIDYTSGLSTLSEARIGLLSDDASIPPEELLGQPVSVAMELRDGSKRHLHGFVTRFAMDDRRSGRHFGYQATVRPWLWFLTRSAHCRIFEKKTVYEIVAEVFKGYEIAVDYQFTNTRAFQYQPRPYCVQYRETDYNFIARLLEEEGIYWFFRHDETKHTLYMGDEVSLHDSIPHYESLPFYAAGATVPPDTDHISRWKFSRSVVSGGVTLRDYDFENPSTDLTVSSTTFEQHAQDDGDIFDYPGRFTSRNDGIAIAHTRVEELHTDHEALSGTTNAQGFESGYLFEMTRHPRPDQNGKYLLTQVSLHAEIDGNEAGSGHAGRFSCRFSAVPVRQQFRPPRRTPKPIMSGPQTAKVIGLDGEEIDTDKYGRIKVHFHWDRPGKKFEKSECWVRVAQVWAGKSFGAMFIPRIGQEVVVDFLEGDPDQPLVTGSVYNGEHMPPWALPEQKTRSGVKSHTHKGNGFNEVSLDDAKGKELINIHAQHDMNTTVLNHDGQSVGGDRTISVSGKHTETIVGDTAITVKKGSLTHDVAEGDAYYHVKGLVDESFDSTLSTTVKKDIQISSTEGFIHVSSDASFVFVSADSSIQMEVGKSRLVMDSQGNITLSGVNVAINGSSSVTIKGAIVTSEAEGANQTKGAVVLSEGTATNTVKGGMVMLNP